MQRNIAEVANETREVALFDFWGGQLPVTCERCDICTVTGEGTSFWNTVRHSFTINLVLAVFVREVPIRTYVMSNTTNQFVTSEGKRSIDKSLVSELTSPSEEDPLQCWNKKIYLIKTESNIFFRRRCMLPL